MQVRTHQPRIFATRRGSTDATIIAVVACLTLAAAGGFFYQKIAQTAVAEEEQARAAEIAGPLAAFKASAGDKSYTASVTP